MQVSSLSLATIKRQSHHMILLLERSSFMWSGRLPDMHAFLYTALKSSLKLPADYIVAV